MRLHTFPLMVILLFFPLASLSDPNTSCDWDANHGVNLTAQDVHCPLYNPPLAGMDPVSQIPSMSADMYGQWPDVQHPNADRIPKYMIYSVALYTMEGVFVNQSNGGYGDIGNYDCDRTTYTISAQVLYPQYPSNGGLPDGDYVMRFGWNYTSTNNPWPSYQPAGAVVLHSKAGVFTSNAPQTPPPSDKIKVGSFTIHIDHDGNQGTGGWLVTCTSSEYGQFQVSADENGSDGTTIQVNLPASGYSIAVHGHHTYSGPNNSTLTSNDDGLQHGYAQAGGSTPVEFFFRDDGSQDGSVVLDNGEASSGPGISSNWITNIVKSLFVPSTGSVNELKRSVSEFFSWGPFGLAQDLVELYTTPPAAKLALGVPYFTFGQNGMEATGTCASVDTSTFTSNSVWSVVRAIMGAGVWLAFGVYVAGILMPRHQI